VAAGHLADAPNFLTGLDDVGTGLAGAGNPAGIPFEQEFADSLSGTIQQGQGDFDAFGVHLLGNNPPAPDPQPGGGSGALIPIGAATSPVLPCDAVMGFQSSATQGFPEIGQVWLNNHGATPLLINKMVLVQDAGGPFTAWTECTDAGIPVNGACKIELRLTRAASDGTTAQLQIFTDGNSKPTVLCGTVAAPTTGIGSGGGGGGGPIKITPSP